MNNVKAFHEIFSFFFFIPSNGHEAADISIRIGWTKAEKKRERKEGNK